MSLSNTHSDLPEVKRPKLKYDSYKRTMQRVRNQGMPRAPTTAKEVATYFGFENVMQAYGMCDDTPFSKTAYECAQFSYALFVCDPTVNIIKSLPHDQRHFMIDATFKIVPYGEFTQLLIMHVRYIDKVELFVLTAYQFLTC